jgi:hypothetical protein
MSLVLPSLPAIPAPTVPLMDPQNPNVWNRVWYDWLKAVDRVERAAAATITGFVGNVVAIGSQSISAFNGSYGVPPAAGSHFVQHYSVPAIVLGDVIAWSIRLGWANFFGVQVYSQGAGDLSMFVWNTLNASNTFSSGGTLDYAVIRAN